MESVLFNVAGAFNIGFLKNVQPTSLLQPYASHDITVHRKLAIGANQLLMILARLFLLITRFITLRWVVRISFNNEIGSTFF